MSTDWAAFFGRLHPLILHLPIGLVAGVVLIELASMWSAAVAVRRLRALFLWVTALSAVAAAASGWLLGAQGYSGSTLQWHRWLGVALAVVFVVLAVVNLFDKALWRRVVLVAALMLVTVTGHLGGTLTHGEGFLAAYAPSWAQGLLGGAPEAASAVDAAALEGDAAIVMGMLVDRCYECHGPGKQKGGLRLDEIAGVESVVRAGHAPGSELFHRITLAMDDPDRMPPEGEAVEDAQILAVMRWINSGADLSGIEAGQQAAAEASASREALLERVRSATGALVVPVDGAPDGDLRVDFARREGAPTAAEVAELAPIAARIVDLSFAGLAIGDDVLEALPVLARLDTLHLERTPVGDAGVIAAVRAAPGLAYLNVHSTRVTAGMLEAAGGLEGLRELYVYGTAIDEEAIAAFRAAHPDVSVIGALSLPDP